MSASGFKRAEHLRQALPSNFACKPRRLACTRSNAPCAMRPRGTSGPRYACLERLVWTLGSTARTLELPWPPLALTQSFRASRWGSMLSRLAQNRLPSSMANRIPVVRPNLPAVKNSSGDTLRLVKDCVLVATATSAVSDTESGGSGHDSLSKSLIVPCTGSNLRCRACRLRHQFPRARSASQSRPSGRLDSRPARLANEPPCGLPGKRGAALPPLTILSFSTHEILPLLPKPRASRIAGWSPRRACKGSSRFGPTAAGSGPKAATWSLP